MIIYFLIILFLICIDKENLRSHEQQIALEINRARTALSRPLRRKCLKSRKTLIGSQVYGKIVFFEFGLETLRI